MNTTTTSPEDGRDDFAPIPQGVTVREEIIEEFESPAGSYERAAYMLTTCTVTSTLPWVDDRTDYEITVYCLTRGKELVRQSVSSREAALSAFAEDAKARMRIGGSKS